MDGLRRCEPRLGTGSGAGAVEGRPLDALGRYPALLVRAAERLGAVPIAHVVEVMRALPFEDGRLDRLAELLQQRCERWGGGSCTEYLDRLASDAGWPEELPALATELTVGETYFFRHPDHFAAFAEIALPARQRARED